MSSLPTPGGGGRFAIAAALVFLSSASALARQAPAPPVVSGSSRTSPADAQAAPAFERIVLTAGRSTVLTTEFEITRIAVTNPAVADAVVVQPREILIDGKAPGTVSLIVWGSSRRVQYDVVVEPGVTTLQQQLQALFPGEDISVSANEEAIILSGSVSSNAVMLRAGEIAQAASSKSKVVNMLQLPGGQQSQQVMLQVRFAEVNRRALTELGVSFLARRNKFDARVTTQQFPAPIIDDEKKAPIVFSDFLNIFFFSNEEGITGVIKALQSRGFFQSLAEPNLIAYNGQEASFLAGGEFPVPIVQGGGTAVATVTITFKEFGIRLNFTPTIAGDTIRLKVRPEVSTLDFNNGITLQGFRIPALTTRRAETDVELRDGQSFAIAGLLNNISQDDRASIPILSSLPIIGNLFKSKADRRERTELMVLITPKLVRPLDPHELPALPIDPKSFIRPGEGVVKDLEGGGGVVDGPRVKLEDRTRQGKKARDKG